MSASNYLCADRGTKLRRPARTGEREDPAVIEDDDVQGSDLERPEVAIDNLQVIYGFAESHGYALRRGPVDLSVDRRTR